ncbi:TIGR02588 family protein [Salinihabitans flavidus]|uniref:TIGR02588 family protein n=1 Tax=Salinihabitans flavidus TaxID=569882 RepID=A0A1H8SBV8_9RHOB|nr:TIGR02588 family protein [Salinihabitans flavidus]SEO76142.1 TIGR02588 family protein [Salinihabitans flavidus]
MGQAEHSRDRTQSTLKGATLEWVVASVAGVIVAAMLGFLLFQAFTKADADPDPLAVVKSVTPVSNGYRMEISARNKGGGTAANIKFRAELRSEGRSVESADVTFSYLPSHSKRQGAFIFENDPRGYNVVLQAESYTAP